MLFRKCLSVLYVRTGETHDCFFGNQLVSLRVDEKTLAVMHRLSIDPGPPDSETRIVVMVKDFIFDRFAQRNTETLRSTQ